jgi:copper chaperone CopZ
MANINFIKPILLLALIISFMSCQQSKAPKENDNQKTEVKTNKTLTLQVEGMTCTGCEATIENKIKGLQGVSKVKADHKKGLTQIEFDSSKVEKPAFIDAIKSTGYKVVSDKQKENK